MHWGKKVLNRGKGKEEVVKLVSDPFVVIMNNKINLNQERLKVITVFLLCL